mgnify:CR=1 FL=1
MSIITAKFRTVKNVLVVSDLHEPYAHKDAYSFLKAVADKIAPDIVINVGDEVDYHALSRYEKDPDLYSSGYEYAAAKRKLDELEKIFPKMKIARSNHGERYVKAATMKAGIPRDMLKTEQELYNKKHWEWAGSHSLTTNCGIVRFVHGTSPDATKYAIQCGHSIVQGHFHNSLNVGWVNTRYQHLFGMTVGCLTDPTSYAVAYAKEAKFAQMLGCGVLINGEPQIIRMELNKNGRWSSKINLIS